MLLGLPFDDQVPFPISRLQFAIERPASTVIGGGGSVSKLTWTDLQLVGQPGSHLSRLVLAMASGQRLTDYRTVRLWTDGAASLTTSGAWFEFAGAGPRETFVTSVSQMSAGENQVAFSLWVPFNSSGTAPGLRPAFGKQPPLWTGETRPTVARISASGGLLQLVPLIDYAIGGTTTVGGREATSSSLSEFQITKVIDSATTPKLWDWIVADATIPVLRVDVGEGGKGLEFSYELRNAKLTRIEYLAERFGGPPTESVRFSYEEICVVSEGVSRCWNTQTQR